MRILKRKQKMGFTLTELMAVVVIIGIIAGLALGSYRSITEKAVFNEGLGIAQGVGYRVGKGLKTAKYRGN